MALRVSMWDCGTDSTDYRHHTGLQEQSKPERKRRMALKLRPDTLRLRLGGDATLLDNRSPREIRQIAQFVQSSESLDTLGSLLLGAAPNLEKHTSTLVYVHNISRHWPRKMGEFESLIRGVSRIIQADSVDEFKKLDETAQQEIWATLLVKLIDSNPVRPCADKAFLRLVNATGFPIAARQLLIPKVAEEYIETANSRRNATRTTNREIDYSVPTEVFLEDAQEHLKNYHINDTVNSRPGSTGSITLEPYRTQILLMLRALYGEENVLSLLERFRTSDTLLCPNEMIDLLEDWENLHQFPADWIAQIRHLEHTR